MKRQLVAASALGLVVLASVSVAQGIAVTLRETRASDEAKREGLEFVERRLQIGNLGLRYRQTIAPAQADQPVCQQYGDYFLGATFPVTWNWDSEYFLDVQVARPNEPPFAANRALLQEGTYVLGQGDRGVAELVWPLPPGPAQPGKLAVRIVKPAGEAEWFYLEARLEGEPDAQITQVRVGAYPFVTTGPPERQRWVSTLTSAHRMIDAQVPLTPATEWGLVLHNKLAQEEGGCLFVFDPAEVQAARAGGTYCVSVAMDAQPGARAAHLAFGYFWDSGYAKAVAQCRADAPRVLERLRGLDWSAPLDVARWQRLSRTIDQLLSHQGVAERFGDRWRSLAQQMRAAVDASHDAAPASREGERHFALLLADAQKLKVEAYGVALGALVSEAAQ